MSIENKRIAITGGASGIGLELVKNLYTNNQLIVIARPSAGLEKLRTDFPDVEIIEADFADLHSVEQAADQIVKSNQPIDILINNAAVQYTPTFLDDDFRYDSIRREIDVNFTSVCSLIYLTLPALLKESPSSIVNINSGLALVPKTTSAIYCATKGALNIFSQSLNHQLEDTNIKVQQVFLPLVATAMTAGRGSGKIPVEQATADIIKGIAKGKADINVGKVPLLRLINRIAPGIARKIMKRG